MALTLDTIIIGGGLIGLLTARELSRRGQTVAIIDRGVPGMESSWAGGGILSPLYPWRDPAALENLVQVSQASYPALASDLKQETGIDPQWRQDGLLILEQADRERALTWAKDNHRQCQWLEPEEVETLAPAVQCRQEGSLWFPDVAQIHNPRLIKALTESLNIAGVTFHDNTAVQRLVLQGSRITHIETDAGRYSAENYILAAGAWSNQLVSDLPTAIPVKPVRGQMLCFKAAPGFLQHMVLREGIYMIPRADGHILVGSTLEDVGFDKRTDEAVGHRLLEQAAAFLPAIRTLPLVKHWSGLRPGTEQGIPYICQYPDTTNLFLNTGHYRSGITLAPASARLLADIIQQVEPFTPVAPFALARPDIPA